MVNTQVNVEYVIPHFNHFKWYQGKINMNYREIYNI